MEDENCAKSLSWPVRSVGSQQEDVKSVHEMQSSATADHSVTESNIGFRPSREHVNSSD
jgi:hypothetical protein